VRYAYLGLVLVVLMLLAVPSASAILVRVVGPDNAPVSGMTVKAINGTTTYDTGLTNGTGWAELDVPAGTVVLVALYNTTTDAIRVVTVASENDTFVINMTALYWVKLYSTEVRVNVTVKEPATGTELEYVANETTIYTDAELNYTYPEEVEEFPYRYVFKELRYDGSVTTDPYVVLSPSANTEVTAVYERQWWIALTTEQIIIVLIASVAIIMLLLAVTRGGARAVLEHRRKYWIHAADH